MATESAEELQRRKRRKRLIQGLLIGAAAIGVPAIANAVIRRRAGKLAPPRWGRSQRYAWTEGEVAFQRIGSGPPLVLLHSFGPGHDGEEWREVAELLAERYRIYVPDLLGWGRSDKPRLTYDGELYIQLIDDFLHDVVGGRATIVAAGLPAAYAVQIAVDSPERVHALGLVVPQGIEVHGDEPDLKDALVHRMLKVPVLGTSALNLLTTRKAIAHHLERDVFASPERASAATIEHHYVASHQPGAHAALAAYVAGYLNHGVKDLLPRLGVPTWLAWGREAANPPVETADLWLRHLKAELQIFEACGAWPHREQPRAFGRGFLSFLSEIGP
ncbi:MAG TPA: alpha/beta hydrolase [Thermoanaerobaculia bacterium]|nr:alpha/beta hydrolase [Thermoanaerobaculia bacterium]